MRSLLLYTGRWLCAALSILAMGGRIAWAQTTPPVAAQTEEDRKLSTVITLAAAPATLKEILSEISRQTGLKIEAPEYLQGRVVGAHLNGIPARAILDSLSELEDWTWQRTEPGRYLVSYKPVRVQSNPVSMAHAFHTTLTRDLRTFCGLDGPVEKALTRLPPVSTAPLAPFDRFEQQLNGLLYWKIIPIESNHLLDLMPQDSRDGIEHPVSALGKEDQKRLVMLLVFQALHETQPRLLRGELLSFQSHIEDSVLQLRGDGAFKVGVYDIRNGISNYSGFGGFIQKGQ